MKKEDIACEIALRIHEMILNVVAGHEVDRGPLYKALIEALDYNPTVESFRKFLGNLETND